MEESARDWLERSAEGFLRKVGLAEGDTVLDFGCNEGNYAAPAARIVGKAGRVYALDKDAEALQEIAQASKQKGLHNIRCLQVPEDGDIPLPCCSVDAVLLYDVLHRGYFPEHARRMKALRSICRVLKGRGMLSFYPTHLKKYGMTFDKALSEVEAVCFTSREESRRRLVHDGRLTRGRVFCYRKRGTCGQER